MVGLGNPGPNYAKTRHNVGFIVADILADRLGSGFKVHKRSGAEVPPAGSAAGRWCWPSRGAHERIGSPGRPAGQVLLGARRDVIIIHDELDIDFGRIRLKLGGGEGGHNGLRSVASALGTKDFQRVRIGIGRPPGRKDPATFVLENFTAAERPEVPTICEQAADATELLIELGLEPAQNPVHAW